MTLFCFRVRFLLPFFLFFLYFFLLNMSLFSAEPLSSISTSNVISSKNSNESTTSSDNEKSAPVESSSGLSSPTSDKGEDSVSQESVSAEQIVVNASRLHTPLKETSSSVSVITSDELDVRQIDNVADSLNYVPGVTVNRSGGSGSLPSIFIRGTDSTESVTLFDGIPVYDPSTIGNNYDYSDLTTDNIEQIEVIRGSKSVLNGSSALGGAVNLVSMRGRGSLKGKLSVEGGSRGSVRSHISSSAGSDKVDFSLGASVSRTDGINARNWSFPSYERDGYKQGNISLRLGANPTDNLRFDLFLRAQEASLDLDNSTDDPDFKVKNSKFYVRPQATLSLFDESWVQTVGFNYFRSRRKFKDDPDPLALFPSFNRSKYLGENMRFDYQSIFKIHDTNSLVVGVEHTVDRMEEEDWFFGSSPAPLFNPKHTKTTGVFLEDRINLGDRLFVNLGVRNDHHSTFKNHATWSGSILYVLPTDTRLKSSFGTGFKAPSLYQLYTSSYGNAKLNPEKSFSWDVGFEQDLFSDRLTIGANYFNILVKDKIEFLFSGSNFFTGNYANYSRARSWGAEAFANWHITEDLLFNINYTYLRTRNYETRESLLRRPKHELGLNIRYNFLCRGILDVGGHWKGKRTDFMSTNLPSYFVARAAVSWQVNKNLQLTARAENLLDKKYEEIYGYKTERLGLYGGIVLSF